MMVYHVVIEEGLIPRNANSVRSVTSGQSQLIAIDNEDKEQ